MKLLLLLFSCLIITSSISAQQLPQYTQRTFNILLINPAVTGIESYWDSKMGYRNQWTGLQGSPTTTYFTLSIPTNIDFTLNDYTQMIRNSDNPIGREADNSYQASQEHSGYGISLVSDKTAQISQTHINASYAYHLKMSNYFNLAVGTSLGINNINLDVNQVTLATPMDPAIMGNTSQVKPEAALGVWGYGPRFFFGLSIQQLLSESINFNTNKTASNSGKTYAQYFLNTGYKFYMSSDLTALPSIVVRPFNEGAVTCDLNIKIAFRDVFWLEGTYRRNDAITGGFGVNIGAFMSFGYSYDYTTSALNTVSNGTHEITLGLFLNNNYNTSSPRHTW